MKNYNVELLKFIAAIGVVLIHYTAQFVGGNINQILNEVARFAVPTFFMLSGYYYKFSHKGFYSNLKIFLVVFVFYLIVLGLWTTFLWFLITLALMHLLFFKLKNVDKKLTLIISLGVYLVWVPILDHETITSFRHPMLYGINNVIIYLPCFAFGMFMKTKTVNSKYSSWSMITFALLGQIILVLLNDIVLINLTEQSSIWQFFIASILVVAFLNMKNYNYKNFFKKLLDLNFEIYLVHIAMVVFLTENFQEIVNASSRYNLAYIIVLSVFLVIVIVVAFILKKTTILVRLGIARK